MRVLCLSTYELGHQPLGIAGPAAALRSAGHSVETADLSIEQWPESAVGRAEAVVFSVPMHTATELAIRAAARIIASRPRPLFAFLGLYASVLEGHHLLCPSDLLAAGETSEVLTRWLETGAEVPARVSVDLGPARLGASPPPARDLLPPLGRYARYLQGGTSSVAASVEATRGCNHRCRHCPVASVYGGRSRALLIDSVVADIDQVVEMGAAHVSFADPDFLNRPRHALAVAEALHDRHPGVSFDATVKIEHLLRYASVLPALARAGLSFVVSAFESTDDAVLSILDKGHTRADEIEAVRVLRSAGIEVRPSWLPFTPWTTPSSLTSLLELSARADLVASTDAVQYSIRLLVPRGSLLSVDPDPVLEAALLAAPVIADQGSLPWRHCDPHIDELQRQLARLVEEHTAAGRSAEETFAGLWLACRSAGLDLAPEPPEADPALSCGVPGPARPRLSEAWFCCAEPTTAQIELVGS
ncbi:MAG: radical SAM protein [Acidimicrobiales bacterium]